MPHSKSSARLGPALGDGFQICVCGVPTNLFYVNGGLCELEGAGRHARPDGDLCRSRPSVSRQGGGLLG